MKGNILVVIPMQKELQFFLQACARHGIPFEHAALGKLPAVRFPGLGMTLARGGTGKAQFALQTQHLLDADPDWKTVVCAGAAGALSETLSIGDVVVATSTVEHDYRNKMNDSSRTIKSKNPKPPELLPLPSFVGDSEAVAGLQRAALSVGPFRVHFGIVASGDEDIVHGDRKKSLRRETGALAVAWEGAGGARACKFSGIPYVEVRGVTDTADQHACSDFEDHLELAMGNITELITGWRIQETKPE